MIISKLLAGGGGGGAGCYGPEFSLMSGYLILVFFLFSPDSGLWSTAKERVYDSYAICYGIPH